MRDVLGCNASAILGATAMELQSGTNKGVYSTASAAITPGIGLIAPTKQFSGKPAQPNSQLLPKNFRTLYASTAQSLLWLSSREKCFFTGNWSCCRGWDEC